MATLVLGAVGAQIGGSIFGGIFGAGMSAMAGRFIGSTLGRNFDERLFGRGASPNSSALPQDVLRVTTSHQGTPITETFGRNRISGHLIWSGGFRAEEREDGFHNIASFALALCHGEVHRFGRVWCDREEVHLKDGGYRFYQGNEKQNPDPAILADKGQAPAYRGICYIVFEDFDLFPFGNRLPNLQFEIFRHAIGARDETRDYVQALAVIPGSGEYTYATSPVKMDSGHGHVKMANMARGNGKSDFENSFRELKSDLPNTSSVSLIVSWFGDDLRVSKCQLTPRVEQKTTDGDMNWRSGGIGRSEARMPSYENGRPTYGGTPSDQSVIEAIKRFRSQNIDVMFYPFILMDVPPDNSLASPFGGQKQPTHPWRGRITLDIAAGQSGSQEGTQAAEDLVKIFIGDCKVTDFKIADGQVQYSGPNEWSYRRFMLHYAFLCKLAGGVDEFLIGSELIGLTTIRAKGLNFPFVNALRDLASETREILGASTKIGYAADWSEYFGYAPAHESGGRYFHLDPLWSDKNIDFVGIDNYMPLSDWRHEKTQLDEEYNTPYSLQYLESNVAGGEGYDWYYKSEEDRQQQIRTPITDGQEEPWIWRYKDLVSWWSKPHYNRPNGEREIQPTSWQPRSKPIYFCEYGAAAMNLSTNQPNKFLDPKSSESMLAYFSSGKGDSFIQAQYIAATNRYWSRSQNNPYSEIYHGRMIDISKSYYWCWDARPWPEFPGRADLWSDGENYRTGHWLNGRVNAPKIANVIAEICAPLGRQNIDVSRVYGHLTGLAFNGHETIRQKLEEIMQAYGIHAYLRGNRLHFVSAGYAPKNAIEMNDLMADENGQMIHYSQASNCELPRSLEFNYIDAEGQYDPHSYVYMLDSVEYSDKETYQFGLTLSQSAVQDIAENYLNQLQIGNQRVRLELALRDRVYQIGEVITLDEQGDQSFLIDQVVYGNTQTIEGYATQNQPMNLSTDVMEFQPPKAEAAPPWVEFVDFPFGDQNFYQIYTTSSPWVGAVKHVCFDVATQYERKIGVDQNPKTMGKLAGAIEQQSPDRRSNETMTIEITNGLFQPKAYSPLRHPLIAIGEHPNREFVGFENWEQISSKTYLLKGVYRGLFGSQIHAHGENASVILLESQANKVLMSDFIGRDTAVLKSAPILDEENYARFQELSPPQNAKRPLSPCHIKLRDDKLMFLPREKGDLDDWRPKSRDAQSFEVEIWDQDSKIYTYEGTSTQVPLDDYLKNNTLFAHIRSIDISGAKSEWIKERLK